MANPLNRIVFSILISTIRILFCCGLQDDRKVYIAYMGALPENNKYSALGHHQSILEQLVQEKLPSDVLIHSYKRSFNGFAASLTHTESQKLSNMKGVVSVFPSTNFTLQTTRSWDFLGFAENVTRRPTFESDMVVGVLDSGICPEAESFSDQGFGPPPKKWKGTCQGGTNFTCNNKIIGARFYASSDDIPDDQKSARDFDGHGTHTASTAAGNQVNGASFYSLAQGNTRGAVPSARIAAYKVCWFDECKASDILAAFDDAIADGVDLLSISLGSSIPNEFHKDPVAIGAFHAMQKGILTSHSAGNYGSDRMTVSSVAPWLLSVAASTTDRQIVDKVVLGDGTVVVGRALNPFDLKEKTFPLVYNPGLLMEGKIVMHNASTYGGDELGLKAAGMILALNETVDASSNFPLPTSVVTSKDGENILSYIRNTKDPVASILRSEVTRNINAPVIASFSSRGPNNITESILKPDLAAPGVEILAAWPPEVPLTVMDEDKRSVKYNIISGTSMSCPHATGAAAYVKSFHPDWSPSAIKSALMTTAVPMSAETNRDAEFAYGSGHINPVQAVQPGLLYEALENDYLNMLCSIGYTAEQIEILSGNKTSCPQNSTGSPKDLNYPTMISNLRETNFTRTVTNVGFANSTYTVTVTTPSNLNATVQPNVISFESLNQKKSFVVTISTNALKENEIISASLVWSDGVHNVRSPVVVYSNQV